MKKIIALVVAILMIASMSVVAFARGEGTEQVKTTTVSEDQGADGIAVGNGTELVYTVSQGYVVTIPDDTVFENLKADGTVSLSNVKVPKTKKVVVKISSEDWLLNDKNNASDPVAYGLFETADEAYDADNALGNDTVVVEANMVDNIEAGSLTGANNSADVYFATIGTSQVGIYLDILTFTAYVVNK